MVGHQSSDWRHELKQGSPDLFSLGAAAHGPAYTREKNPIAKSKGEELAREISENVPSSVADTVFQCQTTTYIIQIPAVRFRAVP